MTFSSTSEALSRLLPGPTVPGFQKVKDADMVGAYQQFLITIGPTSGKARYLSQCESATQRVIFNIG